MENKEQLKTLSKYYCEYCDFNCYQKCDWNRHIIRPKHMLNVTNNGCTNIKLNKTWSCNCGKIFKSQSGLWKHKQKCVDNVLDIDDKTNNNLLLQLLKQTTELQHKITELSTQLLNQQDNNTVL